MLQRAVNRMYQEKKLELGQQLDEEKEKTKKAEENTVQEKKMREQREKQLVEMKIKEIIRRERWILIKKLCFRFFFALGISGVIYIIALILLTKNNLMDFVLSVLGFIISGFSLFREPIKEYNETMKDIDGIAKKELNIII